MKNKKKVSQSIFRIIITAVRTAALLIFVLSSKSSFIPAFAANELAGQAQAIIARTNAIRVEAGLPALTQDARLTQSATAKATDMATRGYFDHMNPDGQRMSYWINGAGYSYALAGENLAKGFHSLDRLMNAWVASSTHYKNLVEPKFTNIGIGIAEGWYEGQETLFVVQHFAVEPTPIVQQTSQLTSGVMPLIAPLIESVAGATEAQTNVASVVTSSPMTNGVVADVATKRVQSAASLPTSIPAQTPAILKTDDEADLASDQSINWPLLAISVLVTTSCATSLILLMFYPKLLIHSAAK